MPWFHRARILAIITLTIASTISLTEFVAAASVPPDVKKVVTFVFPADAQGNLLRDPQTNSPVPYGTGFFVFVKDEAGGPGGYGYLVTAKHVLRGPQGEFTRVFLRLDKRQGDAEFVPLDLTQNGKRVIYTHPDPSVDIAVVPALPDQATFDFKMIPDQLLTTKESFVQIPIGEGSEVFFAGLFVSYYGEHQNIPIFRFGRVGMFPDQPILWKDGSEAPPHVAQLYLLETQSFGGNSGAPVFFYLGVDRNPGSLVVGSPEIRLAGIMRGSFLNKSATEVMQTPRACHQLLASGPDSQN